RHLGNWYKTLPFHIVPPGGKLFKDSSEVEAEVLSRSRLRLTQEQQERWFNLLYEVVVLIEVNVDIDFPRDRINTGEIAA
ncbi:MAG TPA: hypothetical protein DDZ80_08120, partial [Cyanobacteria bacterium UBA8803]|nr:hypothetical protein [Cyanobacteria bacterium UBA8803]